MEKRGTYNAVNLVYGFKNPESFASHRGRELDGVFGGVEGLENGFGNGEKVYYERREW